MDEFKEPKAGKFSLRDLVSEASESHLDITLGELGLPPTGMSPVAEPTPLASYEESKSPIEQVGILGGFETQETVSFLEKVRGFIPEASISTARKIFNKARGPDAPEIRSLASEQIARIKSEQNPPRYAPTGAAYAQEAQEDTGPRETIEVPDDLLLPDTFDVTGRYGSSDWIDRRAESSSITAPDDLVLPDTFDPSGQYGAKKQEIPSPPLPAPGLVFPETPFDPSGGFVPPDDPGTVPIDDDNEPPEPISFIEDAITGKGGRGTKGGAGRSQGPKAPSVKPPPIASQVPPPPPREEESINPLLALAPELAIAGFAASKVYEGATGIKAGSISDYTPGNGGAGGSPTDTAALPQLLMALGKIAGQASRM